MKIWMTRARTAACSALLAAVAAAPSLAQSPLARLTRLVLPGGSITVGATDPAAEATLDCAASKIQHTIRRCALAKSEIPSASALGRRIAGATMNIHFQGQVLDLSIEFAAGNSADSLINQLWTDYGANPRVQYWADDAHLFASYIWIDSDTEVEIAKTIKGPSSGGARLYVSSLLGGLPLSPQDAP